MSRVRSLRLRFLVAFGLFGALLTAVFGSLAWRSVHVAEDLVMDRLLRAEVEQTLARRTRDPAAPLPSGLIKGVSDPSALPAALQDRAPSLAEGAYEIKGAGEARYRLHVRAQPDGQRLYLYLNEGDVEASEAYEQTAHVVRLVLIGVATLLGVVLGLVTTRRIIAPVRRMTDAVAAHTADRPPPDLRGLVSDDELGVLAEQLESALGRVAASNRQEQLFGRYASHELRSSLAVTRGVAELLTDLGDVRLQRPLARLDRATEDMGAIIETCLWLARSQGQLPPPEPVAIAALTEELLGPLRARSSAQVALRVDAAPNLLLLAPRLPLRMIVSNLLTNAHRHTARGEIVVSAGAHSVEVRDTGPGIPPEILDRVTEPHVRGPGEGHGLGLAIVHGLCGRLGWRFEVESVVGEGTVARVWLGDEALRTSQS